MSTLYWFALVVGAGLLLFSLVGDADGGADGVDADGGFDGTGHGYEILSIRTATYFLFAFGATGVLLPLAGASAPFAFAVSLIVAALSGGLSATAFRYLRRSQSGAMPADDSLVGLVGRVTLPISPGGSGKIEVERAGRTIELLARPFEREPDMPENWHSVVVVEVDGGTALVAPYRDLLDPGEVASGLPSPAED